MRILYLNHNVAGSGTYQRASRVAASAAARGHEPTLITTRRRGRLQGTERVHEGVRIIEAPDLLSGRGRTGWDPWNTLWRMHAIRRGDFDLVHAFDCRPAVIAPALRLQRSGVPLILDWADWWGRGGATSERPGRLMRAVLGGAETWLEESFRTRAQANTVISDALKARAVGLGVPEDRLLVFPNGCDRPADAGADRKAARHELNLDDVPLLLHLGAIYPGDAELMFDALRRVRASRRVRLVLVGEPGVRVPDDLIRDGTITRTGFVDAATLALWLASADAGIVPLRDNVANRARWPGKINEYFTAGLPAVMTRVGPAAGWVEHHGAGRVSAPEPPALAAVLEDVLGDGPARAAMAAAGRSLAAGALAWPRITEPLFAFYARWVQGCAQRPHLARRSHP